MVIVQALLAMVTRSAGRALNTAFGWATAMLFGKVPERKQIYLSVLAFGSVAWLIVIVGIAFPSFATFLLGFVTLPDWIDKGWIRIAMLVAAVVIPLLVGAVSLVMVDAADRPKGLGERAMAVLKGYPYTLGLAITLVMMTAFAPVLKVRDMARRWTSEHIPIIVEPRDYLAVVGDLQAALERGGLETHREPATWMLRLPTRVLTIFAGGAVKALVADQLTTLTSEKIEVLLHPSDLIVSGRKVDAAHAHGIITEQITFTRAHLTWTKEANQVEDRLRAIWEDLRATRGADPGAMARLHAVEEDLRTLEVDYEEWETLFRQKLQVERGMLQVAAGIADHPTESSEGAPEALSSTSRAARSLTSGRDTTLVEVPIPTRALAPLLAAITAAVAFVAMAWRRLTGGPKGVFG